MTSRTFRRGVRMGNRPGGGGRGPRFKLPNIFLILLGLFGFFIFVVLIWFVYQNVIPYVQYLQGTNFDASKVASKVNPDIPRSTVFVIVGFGLWFLLQFLQLFPSFVRSNEAFLKSLIDASDSRQYAQEKQNDSGFMRGIKRTYNGLPTEFLDNMGKIRIVAYLGDFYIQCCVNPIIKGWDFLPDLLFYGDFSIINGTNLLTNIQTIFAVELLIMIGIWTWKLWNAIRKQGQTRNS